jgi:cell wall-associated NlpC family hydrolase
MRPRRPRAERLASSPTAPFNSFVSVPDRSRLVRAGVVRTAGAGVASTAVGRRRDATIVFGLVGIVIVSTAAAASPEIRSKQEQAEAIVAQVQALEEEVGAAAERFNGANYRLQRLSNELKTTRVALTRARSDYRLAHDRAAARLVEMYVSDESTSALEVILGARSLADLLDRLEASERIAEHDAALVEQLREYRAQVAAREKRLRRARSEQAELVHKRASERAAIEAKLAERERLLSSVRAEVERLKRQERARQARLERQARVALEARRRAQAARERRRREAAAVESESPVAAEEASEEARQTPARPPQPAVSPPAPPADATRGAQVVAIAMRYLGVPYKWGGASPSTGFDCSGFTMYVFAQIGVSLPHYAAAQYRMGVPVSRSQLQPGDLVFFSGLGHMGMYIGGGNFIHAPQTGDVVKISSIHEPYRVANWVGARRVL